MAVKEVTIYGNPVLSGRCRSVSDFSGLDRIYQDMLDTMYEEEGIGLAANQIGLDLNMLIIDVSHIDETGGPQVLINGEIIDSAGEETMEEGCLSLPGLRLDITRPEEITVRYQTMEGSEKTEKFCGLAARVIQHELDHLNGILIVDRVSALVKLQYNSQIKELKKRGQAQPAA